MKNRICFILLFLPLFTYCSYPLKNVYRTDVDYEEIKMRRLAEIKRSVLKVVCSAYYDNYYYKQPENNLESVELEDLFIEKQMTTNSVSGSAVIIYKNPQKMLLLSCNHIFDFKDTIRVYYADSLGIQTDNIQSVSIKYDQRVFVNHRSGTRSIGHLLAYDKANDIALLETSNDENQLAEIPFEAFFKNKADIRFGKEVYMIGYPKGFLSIANGLVSASHYKNRFLISASFNRGFSGGLVIAFDKNSKSFQYVGIANSMAYDSHLVLAPNDNAVTSANFKDFPYTDEIYVKDLKLVSYGLTFGIKNDVIFDFIEREKEGLRLKGFLLP